MRIGFSGKQILEASIVKTTREVCQINVSDLQKNNYGQFVLIDFEFQDYEDGVIIQVISEFPDTNISIKGTIIGIPQGFIEVGNDQDSNSLSGFGCIIPSIIQLATIIAIPYVYKIYTGINIQIWLLLILLGIALTVPIGLVSLYFSLKSRSGVKIKFPKGLTPPGWYGQRLYFYEHFLNNDRKEKKKSL